MDGELEQLGERIAEQAAHLDAAMHRLLTDLRVFDQRGGWHRQGALSCAHWLAWRVGWSLVTARDHVRVARKLADFSLIDDALRRGEVSYSKVRAVLRIATPANEGLLLEYARLMTGSQLENTCRKYGLVLRGTQDPDPQDDEQRRYVRRRDTDDGMIKIEAVLHPEEAEAVWTMLNHAATRLTREPASAQTDDSAESCSAVPERAGMVGPGQATAPAGTKFASPVPSATMDRIDDSAESCGAVPGQAGMVSAPQSTAPVGTQIASPVPSVAMNRIDVDPIYDSAESCGAVPSQAGMVKPPADRIDDLADGVGDSAESSGRSLLDRLLDEADALRAAQAVPAVEGGAMTEDGATAEHSAMTEDAAPVSRAKRPRGASWLVQREDATKRAFNRADALVSLAQGYLRGSRPNRSPVEITITIPQSTLAGEGGEVGEPGETRDPVEVGEMSGSFLSREAVRRLSCDAGVIEIVEDDRGAPLSVGRKRRTIAGALKRALHQRDATCTFPGCTHRIFLEGHHIKHWADGGETTLLNTTLLCSLCRARHKLHYAGSLVMPGSVVFSTMMRSIDPA